METQYCGNLTKGEGYFGAALLAVGIVWGSYNLHNRLLGNSTSSKPENDPTVAPESVVDFAELSAPKGFEGRNEQFKIRAERER